MRLACLSLRRGGLRCKGLRAIVGSVARCPSRRRKLPDPPDRCPALRADRRRGARRRVAARRATRGRTRRARSAAPSRAGAASRCSMPRAARSCPGCTIITSTSSRWRPRCRRSAAVLRRCAMRRRSPARSRECPPSGDSEGWIRGVGYFESVAGELDRARLDRLAPARPLRIQHRSGALWMLNSAAVDRLGLDRWDGRAGGRARRRGSGDRAPVPPRRVAARASRARCAPEPRRGRSAAVRLRCHRRDRRDPGQRARRASRARRRVRSGPAPATRPGDGCTRASGPRARARRARRREAAPRRERAARLRRARGQRGRGAPRRPRGRHPLRDSRRAGAGGRRAPGGGHAPRTTASSTPR